MDKNSKEKEKLATAQPWLKKLWLFFSL